MKKGEIFFVLLLVSQVFMIAGDYMNRGYRSVFSVTGFILCVIADIIFLYVYFIGSQKEKVEKELEEVKFLTEMERKKNDLLSERQKKLQDKKAELEYEMNRILEKVENGESAEVVQHDIEAFQKKFEETKGKTYCSNMVVNAVIRDKDKKCEELGFDLELDLMIPNKLEVEPLHICSIFANLLDNALEAVAVLEQSKRRIELCAEIKGKYLCVKVSNTATKEHVKRKKRKNRGYGSLILRDIAQKYEGTYTTSYADGIYSATMAVKAV